MQFQHRGITVSVAEDELRRLVLERLDSGHDEASPHPMPPRIGAEWPSQGGIYAGVVRGLDDEQDYYLIIGSEYDGTLQWQPAVDWAIHVQAYGFTDYALWRRREQALSYANVPELFKPEIYWSCEQPASSSAFAWLQYFYNGYQDTWTKTSQFRARAVRRIPIQ